MAADPSKKRARDLLVRYLEQMREAGETELYLSREIADALKGKGQAAGSRLCGEARPVPDGGRVGAARKSARETSHGGGAAGGSGGGSSASSARAEEVPEREVVKAELAVFESDSTADMFAEPSPLDGCASLEDVEKVASTCEKCELSRGRTNVVFGVGNPKATLMFVGEAPGRDEDIQGIPFVGRAGQLLDKILAAAGIRRDDVYIGNIIKCRPPNNRTPLTSEIQACMPYLAKQIEHISPRIICTLGLPATQTLLGVRGSMGSLRGTIYEHKGILIIPTYHTAAALRDPRYKKPIWEDFLVLKREYDRCGGGE